jgi:protease IV
MKQFLKFVLATIVGLGIFSGLIFIFFAALFSAALASKDSKVTVESNSVLKLDLNYEIHEKNKDKSFADLDFTSPKLRKEIGLTEILESIKKAKTDNNIKGIYLEMGVNTNGLATIGTIRDALLDFRKSGKFVYAYGDVATQRSYYLATAADQIFLNPSGAIQLTGFGREITYFKGMFDKLGVDVQDFHCGAFKSAIEPFIRKDMSGPCREQLTLIYSDVYSLFLNNISKERKIDTVQLNNIINNLEAETPEKDKNLKLIDDDIFYDQVVDKMKEKTGVDKKKNLEMIEIGKYYSTVTKNLSPENKIAVVYAEGTIVDGEGKDDEIGGDKFAKIIRKLRKDDKVKAIVLRVNSPGGSALASDIMWRELILAKKEKPLIMSFGDLAASGGYYISCMGDRIFAEPSTITGSIGVFGLIPNAQKLFNDKLGITFDEVKINKHGVFGGITKPLDAEESAFVQRDVEKVYREFKEHVAEGRKKDTAYIETIAQGRVWTGREGLQLGLVDTIGGLDDAIAYAAKQANLKEYKLKLYPEEKSLSEKIAESFGDMKADYLKNQLGSDYEFYKTVEWVKNAKGVQARMVYDLGL